MDERKVSGFEWMIRIAIGVLVGNVMFALAAWFLTLSAWTLWSPSTSKPEMDAKQMSDLTNQIEQQTANMEALSNSVP